MKPLADIAADLAAGRTTSATLVDEALARIDDESGEGSRTFIRVHHDAARAAAKASDRMRGHGTVPSPLAGIPVSVKDLCDIAGETTLAGSLALKQSEPAKTDATAVARLRAAGAVIVGTTNMVEFALGGLGLNPHYGTPANPWDRDTRRVPGGSSSGAAVSVTDGMAAVALGTDTAGSVRMPAALCGLTGSKPTARRTPTDGMVPLSSTLDSVGPLAPTVACCALMDAVFAGEAPALIPDLPLAGLRLGVAQTVVQNDLDETVSKFFGDALTRLSDAGARVTDVPLTELGEIRGIISKASLPITEGYAWHRDLLERAGETYDPIIAARFRSGEKVSAADYIDLLKARRDLIARADRATAPFDAIVMPAMATVAPPIADFDDNDELWAKLNALFIRNTSIANFLDRPAITLPCHTPGDAPVGLMLVGATMGDRHMFAVAKAVEGAIGHH